MRVLKFGGTSLANPERFSQAAQLIEKAHLEEQAAGVLSAPAKITNHLVALSEKAALNQPTDTHFNEAIEIFYNIINGLHAENNKFDLAGTKALIDAEFAQIKGLLEEIRQAGKVEDNFSPRQSMVALTLSSTLPAWRISSNKPLIWANSASINAFVPARSNLLFSACKPLMML